MSLSLNQKLLLRRVFECPDFELRRVIKEGFENPVFECPDFEFELDFDRQTPHSNSGQNPGSAVRRRLSTDHSFVLNASESLMVNTAYWTVNNRACEATEKLRPIIQWSIAHKDLSFFFNHKGDKTNQQGS